MNNTNKEWLAKRYSTTCPHCNKGIQATRSLGMLAFGMTEGYGKCVHCQRHIQIKWDDTNDTLLACQDEITDKLNNILFESLERLNDDEIINDPESAKKEIETSIAIKELAKVMVTNASNVLKAQKFKAQTGEIPYSILLESKKED